MSETNTDEHSRSCVRAGFLLLLASAFGVSLVASLARIVNFDAYGAYVSDRLALQNGLEELDREPCFLDIATRPYADESRSWSLDQLSRYLCGPLNAQFTPVFSRGREDAPTFTFRMPTAVEGSPPPAPQDVRVWGPLRPAHGIYNALQGLREQRTLDLARKVNTWRPWAAQRRRSLRLPCPLARR